MTSQFQNVERKKIIQVIREGQCGKVFNNNFTLNLVMETVHHVDKDKKGKIQKGITEYLKDENGIVFAYIHGSFLEKGFKDIDIGIYILTFRVL